MRRLVALALAFLPAPLGALAQSPAPSVWPHQASDLPADPRIHFGVLANGMRWAWMDNAEPKKRCYVRMHVDVGSLAEDDSERGLAHFLEHMAFNGSKNHPPGTLIHWFQKHGMDFGADTNASTGYSQTVYALDLPESDEATLREGLAVLRDFADGLLLEQKEIDAEKGVVDAEEREAQSASRRVREAFNRRVLSGTRIADRDPLGVAATRSTFTSESVRAFYERWYRPDNTTLVLVGDLQGKDPLPLVEQAFASWKKPAEPLRREPDAGKTDFAQRIVAIHEPELPATTIVVQKLAPWRERKLTRAQILAELPRACARRMINLRFAQLQKAIGAPFLTAYVGDAHDRAEAGGIRVVDSDELVIQCPKDMWKDALATCERELRRALEHGFTESEVTETKLELERSVDRSVERESTRPSSSWLEAILGAAESGLVPSAAATRSEVLKLAARELDGEACRKALHEAWSQGTLVITVSGPLDLGPEAEKLIREAYEASVERPVEAAPKSDAALVWAYASDPQKSGKIAARVHDPEFDVHTIAFDNGVRVYVKKTDFEAGQVLASVQFARGRLDLTPEQFPIGWMSEHVVEACALAAHSIDDLRKLSAGKDVNLRYRMVSDQFELAAPTTQAGLQLQCEWMCAQLMHAGWREEGLREFKKQLPLYYESLEHQLSGPLQTVFLKELYSGDKSRGIPAQSDVEGLDLAKLRAWLEPHMRTGALDVVLVGDLDLEATVEIAARTFGMLAPRRALDPRTDRRKPAEIATGLRRRYEVETQDEKALVWIVFPTTDGRDLATKRALRFLAGTISDHLLTELREKLGGAYSPNASAATSDAIPGDGYIAIEVTVDPAHVDTIVESTLALTDKLATDGPTKEEIDRLRVPALNQLRDARSVNSYWWNVLTRTHSRDNVFEELRTEQTWLEKVGVDELAPLAKRYLKRERASVAVVVPKAKSATDEPKKSE
ncbi:MAG: M16 family metallopeptidase [Planctomycetota bacterium]